LRPSLADTLMKCCGSDPQGKVRITDLLTVL
jgi:hypothetical protein